MTNENDHEKSEPSQQPSKPQQQPQKEPISIPLREGEGRPLIKRENDKNDGDDGERIFRRGE